LADQIKADITTGLAIADEPSIDSNTLFDTALNEISTDDNEQNQASSDVDWAIKTNLEEAVNTGEFVVYYEPRIAPAFDHVVGATAHLRWHSSHQRILLPHQFLETAAQSGLIEPIIHGMIKTSFSQVSRWKGELSLALSIPLGLFSDDTLMLLLKDLLAIFNLPAERIILSLGDAELDEDDYQLSAAQEIIAGIRAMGFKISGHVQPDATLNTITLDEYQVDADLLKQRNSHVADLVAKAKNERAKVLVYKVANHRDVDYFKKIGVDTLQGAFYSPAIPQPEFRTWLTRKAGA
jgi:EAL domain-containing protein (putative c-di-GMP-specific phosphodiesterase class I)